jgi:PAS domain S-box-containing protein
MCNSARDVQDIIWSTIFNLYFRSVMQQHSIPLGSAEAILDSITDAFYFLNNDWQFTYVNRQTNVVLDRQPGELLGKTIWDEYPGLVGLEFEVVYRRAVATQVSESFTAYFPDHQRWYEVHCYPSPAGLSVYFRNVTERVRADDKLRNSETRFRLMADSIPQIVWITDAEGSLEFFNQQWLDYSGATVGLKPLDHMIGQFLHPDDQERTLQAWHLSMRTGDMFIVEHRIRAASGEYRWFLARALPQRDPESGKILRWFGTSTDIHNQRKIAQELEILSIESDRRRRLYETFLSELPDLAYVFDQNHRFAYANKVLLQMWGKTWDEAIGKNCLELGYEPWHAEMHDREIEIVKATAKPIRGEVPFDGTFGRRIYDYIFFPVFGAYGEVEAVAGITRDVTDREQSAARSNALIQLTDAIRMLDSPADITQAAVQILGTTLRVNRVGYGIVDGATETLKVGREWNAHGVEPLSGALHLRDFGTFLDDLKHNEIIAINDVRTDPRTAAKADALVARSATSFINVPVMEQGELVALLYVNHSYVRNWNQGELDLIREITERAHTASERLVGAAALRDSEARLRQINETLEEEVAARTRELMVSEEALRHSQKMEAVGQLTGGLAHDFNNLLGGIMGSLELARLKVSSGRVTDIDRYLDVAYGASKRAASLTHRLLAFSRRQTLAPNSINANKLITGMEDLIRRTLGPSIELEVVGAGGLWLTYVDAPQLENALLNLCINARDAMPDGGRVTIETANKWLDGHWASERGLLPGQYVSVCVTDTGTGMTPEVIARAFDPFFTTKPLGEGTGLGLSMVYGFARQSGGQIRIYSEVGMGTTMCVYLPRFQGEEVDDPDVPQADEVEGTGGTVLVVDDESSIRMMVVEVLNESGYSTLEAGDGRSALAILQSDAKIDLLITDVGLPGGMNGRQIADAARISRPDLKVLFITGYAENAVFGNAHVETGMQVLTKPFTLESLSRRIQQIVEC